jgi:hypothetical protein
MLEFEKSVFVNLGRTDNNRFSRLMSQHDFTEEACLSTQTIISKATQPRRLAADCDRLALVPANRIAATMNAAALMFGLVLRRQSFNVESKSTGLARSY